MDETAKNKSEFSDFIVHIASQAGFEVVKESPTIVTITLDLKDGRAQTVWIKPAGTDNQDNPLISITSAAAKIPKGQNLSQSVANELLRQNTNIAHGAWGINKIEENEYLVAMVTMIAKTMQPEDFKASVVSLAMTADNKEKEMGVDIF